MAEVASRRGHLLDGRTAVRPVGVAVQVALERGAQGGGLLVEVEARGVLQAAQVGGGRAVQRLGDRQGGDLADALQVGQAPRPREPYELVARDALDGGRGAAEGAHPVGRLARPLKEKGDPLQRFDRFHNRESTRRGWHSPVHRSRRPAGRPLPPARMPTHCCQDYLRHWISRFLEPLMPMFPLIGPNGTLC